MGLNVSDLEGLAMRAKNTKMAHALGILARSINDWPLPVGTVNEYVRSVEDIVCAAATKANLERYLGEHRPGTDAWKAESIAGLLEIYKHCDVGASLSDIVSEIEANIDGM
jgi:hypothetical protein